MRMEMTISARDRPPWLRTPPIIRQGTQIMPPAQTAAMDSQLCRCSGRISNPVSFCINTSSSCVLRAEVHPE